MIRGIARNVARSASRMQSVQTVRPMQARLMSSLDKKEKGDEALYVAKHEAARLAEMKAKVEAIMCSENAEDKEQLEEVLGTYPLLKFSCPYFALPPHGFFFFVEVLGEICLISRSAITCHVSPEKHYNRISHDVPIRKHRC